MSEIFVGSVFEFKTAEINYEAATTAGTVDIYTDMNGAWATATNASLAVTTAGPATKTVDLAGIKGTAYSVKFTAGASTATLTPRSGNIKVRRIGLYLVGGGVWETKKTTISV